MINEDKQSKVMKSVLMNLIHGLTYVLTIIEIVLFVPALYGRSVDWISTFAANNYGAEVSDFASFVWSILLSLLATLGSMQNGGMFITPMALSIGAFVLAAKIKVIWRKDMEVNRCK